MKADYKKSFLASFITFVLGTSCCWITSLAIWFGGATILTLFANFLGKYNIIFIVFAILFLGIGIYQLWGHRKK